MTRNNVDFRIYTICVLFEENLIIVFSGGEKSRSLLKKKGASVPYFAGPRWFFIQSRDQLSPKSGRLVDSPWNRNIRDVINFTTLMSCRSLVVSSASGSPEAFTNIR